MSYLLCCLLWEETYAVGLVVSRLCAPKSSQRNQNENLMMPNRPPQEFMTVNWKPRRRNL